MCAGKAFSALAEQRELAFSHRFQATFGGMDDPALPSGLFPLPCPAHDTMCSVSGACVQRVEEACGIDLSNHRHAYLLIPLSTNSSTL